MAQFVMVKAAPTDLKKGDFVIQSPNFFPEINQQRAKAPKTGLVARFHLRLLVDTIGQNYDPENMTGWVVKSHLFEGRPFKSDAELNDILVEALSMCYPQIFNKYLEQKLKTRPAGTETLYLVDSGFYDDPEAIFFKYGMSETDKIDDGKPHKTVGKPAVTKEQGEHLKAQKQTT